MIMNRQPSAIEKHLLVLSEWGDLSRPPYKLPLEILGTIQSSWWVPSKFDEKSVRN
jgi:hypothetical protein